MRTGRASTALLDGIRVDYYGNPTPISQMASVSMPDARTLVVQPWEAAQLGGHREGHPSSPTSGCSPVNDGKLIRLAMPTPTEERRKQLVKTVAKMAEDARVAVRNIRREANDKLKVAGQGQEGLGGRGAARPRPDPEDDRPASSPRSTSC